MKYISTSEEKAFILAAIAAQKAQGTVDYAVVRKAYEAMRKHENWINSKERT